MSFKRSSMRYGHTEGFTYCGYSETGEHFLSCGPDGDLRTWASIDDDDPSSKCMGEFATSLLQIGNRLLVGADLNTVQGYTYPELGRDGIDFRFTAMVTSIKANKTFLAAASDDMMIKAFRLDRSEEVFELAGHEGPVLQIDLGENMSSKFLASSSGDGTIKIWDLTEKKAFKTIEGLPKVNSFDGVKVLSTPTFERKTGKLFAYPLQKEIIVMDTVNWSELFRLVDKNIKSDYSVCEFSPCGQYMAAGTVKGEFSMWNVKSSCPVREATSGADTYPITSLAWNPTGNHEVVYADSAGQIGQVRLLLEDEPEGDNADGMEEDVDDIYNNIDFQEDEAEEDNENCVSLSKLKRDTFKSETYGDADIERPNSAMSSVAGVALPTAKVYPQQEAFQPSATPETNGSQYLVWNNVGIICLHTVDDNISVDFHDASVHHAIHMKNYFNYTMGGLSKNVVALAGGRKLTGITFKAFGSKEWSVELSDLEEIVALAASDKLVAAATDSRHLRLFSTMGTQREVVSIPGEVVAVAAHDDKVMVAYHNGPASEDQHLSLMLVQAIGYNLRCRDIKLPLSPTAKLTWLGYTDRGAPVTYDSKGLLRIYGSKSNLWFPICETTQYLKGASDGCYIVDVSEAQLICRAVLCRGKPHPPVVPKPIVTPLKLEVPLCELQSEKGGLEEELVRYSILNVDDAEKMFKERALKLFASACRTEAEFRARDLVEIIATPQFVELAVRYASKLGRIHLSERIMEMLPNIEEQEKENEKMLKASEDSLLMNTSLNTSGIILSTRERLSKTPTVVPKPMLISQQKRNPFRKTSQVSSTVNDKASPLSHLTGKAVGFADEDSQVLATPLNVSSSNTVPDSLENVRNNKPSEQSPRPAFMVWFQANRAALEAEFPDADIPALTREATKRYRSIPKDGGSTGKRKMEDAEKKETGVSKLAKFGFVTE